MVAFAARAEESVCAPAVSAFSANGGSVALQLAAAHHPLDILAIGSSSTEGIGASSPTHAYPARLAVELAAQGGLAVEVRNAGVGGEAAAATLARLKAALSSGWPQMVIWQVGTNDALTAVDEAGFRVTLEDGVAAARAAGVPLVLVDPQFLPRAAGEPRYRRFVGLVDEVGARDHVPVFSRYAMMRAWAARAGAGNGPLLGKDGIHMSDLGYACLAHGLAQTIESAVEAKPAGAASL